MFRKLVISFAAAAGLMSQLALPAEAGIGAGAFAPPASLVETSPVENAQFVWGGRNYCWYNSAWRGPGWYWCGLAWRVESAGAAPPAGMAGTTAQSTSIGMFASIGRPRPQAPGSPQAARPSSRSRRQRPGHGAGHRPGGGHARPPAHRPGGGGHRPGGGGHHGGGHRVAAAATAAEALRRPVGRGRRRS